ncbi:MAG: flagellar basal body P-ring biosynthesis protein [Actinobacteria bacterium]|nr:flagellar basal body P-ring biosynthesis protein [Actinomycetota bacterium]
MNLKNLDLLKNSKLAMGLALLILAISAGLLIAKEANRTVYVWASNGELAPGNTIATADLKAVSVLLPESAKNYISANAQLVGAMVMHRIGTGDLIPVGAISVESQKLAQRAVPLTVEITDLPVDLQRGDVIDIYAIPNSSQKSISEPELITSAVTVAESSNKNNSGKALVVVNLPEDLVMRVLTFISESRLIIVRSNF